MITLVKRLMRQESERDPGRRLVLIKKKVPWVVIQADVLRIRESGVESQDELLGEERRVGESL